MTNKEALIGVLRVNVPDNTLEKALLDQGVTGASTYTANNLKSIDLAAIDVFVGLLSEPDVSEGGYSIRYDRDAVLKLVLYLAKKHNVTTVLDKFRPSVTSRNVW
jgi:hypothetical protein